MTSGGLVYNLAGSDTGALGFPDGDNIGADGTGTAAVLVLPQGLCSDASGNIYLAELYACSVRRITTAGVVTTIAGLGYCSGNFVAANGVAALSADLGGIAHIQSDGAGGFLIGARVGNVI